MTQAKCIVSNSNIIYELSKDPTINTSVNFFAIEDILNNTDDLKFEVKTNNNDIACILSSSGTTDVPKAVAITNRNIFCNIERATEIFHYSQESKVLTWSPIQHVLGLTIHMIMGVYQEFQCILFLHLFLWSIHITF